MRGGPRRAAAAWQLLLLLLLLLALPLNAPAPLHAAGVHRLCRVAPEGPLPLGGGGSQHMVLKVLFVVVQAPLPWVQVGAPTGG
jgi:hypothetical protein